MPVSPAFGLLRLPAPRDIFFTAVRLTPAELKALSGMRHWFQPAADLGTRIGDHGEVIGGILQHDIGRSEAGPHPAATTACPQLAGVCQSFPTSRCQAIWDSRVSAPSSSSL